MEFMRARHCIREAEKKIFVANAMCVVNCYGGGGVWWDMVVVVYGSAWWCRP